MRNEHFINYGSGPEIEVEGMRDESFRDNATPETVRSHHQEAEDVNEIVLRFNTELATADLSNQDEVASWVKDIAYVLENNADQGTKLLSMFNERLAELKQQSEVEGFVAQAEQQLADALKEKSLDKDIVGKAQEQGQAKEEQGM